MEKFIEFLDSKAVPNGPPIGDYQLFAGHMKAKLWHYKGKLNDGPGGEPAITFLEIRFRMRDGKLHCSDGGPAKFESRPAGRNMYEYWDNGQRHRGGGLPAIHGWDRSELQYCDPTYVEQYYVKGVLTRPPEEGPANISDQTKTYVVDGVKHNPFGPAVVTMGCKSWWIKGKQLTEQEFTVWQNAMKNMGLIVLSNNRSRRCKPVLPPELWNFIQEEFLTS